MIFLSKEKLQKMIQEHIKNAISECVISLDKNKQYILVLPTDIPPEEVREALKALKGPINLVVLQADYAKLIELK